MIRSIPPRLRALALSLLLALPAAARAGAAAWGRFEANIALPGPLDFSAPARSPMPVDLGKPLGNPRPPFSGLWAYANDEGRVRAYASTGTSPQWLEGKVYLQWEKTFQKGADTDRTTFTVNKSWLQVQGDLLGRNGEEPWAELDFEVAVWPFTRQPIDLMPVFNYRARIGIGQGGLQVDYAEARRKNHPWLGCGPTAGQQGGVPVCTDLSESLLEESITREESTLRLETQSYTDEIDLSAFSTGDWYTVTYRLYAAASQGTEGHSEAFIGDPLDPQGGVLVTTTSLPVDDPGPRLCAGQGDAARWIDGGDGTVSDRYTGLTWRRCPLGYTLETGGTASLADDRCRLAGARDFTWQGALQAAVADVTGGHADWRVPNLKELASLLAPRCMLPAIERDPFPDTPATAFWTSTAPHGSALSRAVDFGSGLDGGYDRTSTLLVRLVRDGPPPAPPLPGLRLGRPPPVRENAPLPRELVFPVLLDRPASGDVTVAYQTFDYTAVAGADYTATAGTLTIPAGATAAEIRVPVLDDDLAEENEALYLVLTGPSPGVRLLRAAEVGGILDEEPRLRVHPADAYEGDAGTSELVFEVTMSAPAVQDVSFDWATADGTATAGADHQAASGRATIPAGSRSALLRVTVLGDTAPEGDETLTVTLSGITANAFLEAATATGTILEDDRPAMQAWNDSGATRCADATVGNLTCPVAGFPGQDAETGRDATAASDADGRAGFSFTKLDATGAALDAAAAAWDCVRDEVTGLTWERKTNDGGLRDRDWTYTWYSSRGSGDGGTPGTENGGTCADTASCDTEKYAAAVNAAGLCGHSDWRLPSFEELFSLTDAGNTQGAPHSAYFADSTAGSTWWMSTTLPRASTQAWRLSALSSGIFLSAAKSSPGFVRLVRGGATPRRP